MKGKVVLAALLLAPTGCARHGGAPSPSASAPSPSASAGPSAAATAPSAAAPAGSASTSAAAETPTRAPVARAACRALTVQGAVVTANGQPLTSGAAMDAAGWVAAPAGARVGVKHLETTRELVFEGPASFLACERGEERFLLTSGDVHTATWAGARPGAEVLLGTPFGAVRYGDAKLDVHLDDQGLTVGSDVGDAFIELPLGAGEEKITGGKRFSRRGRAPDVKALVGDCEKSAAEAESRARAVLAPGRNAAPLGTRAAAHVRARKAARASCAIAAAAVETAKTQAEKDDLLRRVAYAEARWRSVP
ncbi:MAG TPA: hypothetical protein VHC69_08165 [Polyangiaceae bacterium]|nr:hypothetical protein [Polyangiaceae bacterium]